MFNRTKTASRSSSSGNSAHHVIAQSLGWEESRIHLLEKSESRAWWIARAAILGALLSVTALAVLAPFYTVVPVVFQVDKLSQDILSVQIGKPTIPQSEAMDMHWLATYVQTRERYVWTLLQTDYYATMAMSDPIVGSDYRAIYEGVNALDKKLGEGTDIRITLLSVELIPGAPGKAQVTWERTMRQKGLDIEKGRRFVSSISYVYTPPAALSRQSQIIANPFGFKVDGYAVAAVLSAGKSSTTASSSAANTAAAANASGAPAGAKP